MNRTENRLLPVVASGSSGAVTGVDKTKPCADALASRDASPPLAPPYAAQLMGQGAQRRGLKGGQPVLKAANAAYLGTEYSGDQDRRPPPGLLKRTTI